MYTLRWIALTFIMPCVCLLYSFAPAEVILDGSFGTGGSITGPNYLITSDMGKLIDRNLFHSFDRFNINRTESATFTGPDIVQNIISRVTGGSTSNIDGLLRSNIQGADLFFINPAGVVFGPNATLDVPGSFHVSTADYILLSDGGRFDASNPGNSILTVAPPSAFGFLNSVPNNITVNGSLLKVPEGKTLSMVGGNLNIQDGNLFAESGTINLVSVASSGEAVFEGLHFNPSSFSKLGAIEIKDSRSYSDSPRYDFTDLRMGNIDVSGKGGGKIFIRGGHFVMEGADISDNTHGEGNAEGIDIMITGDMILINARIESDCRQGARGNAGDIKLDMKDSVSLSGIGSVISSATYGKGNGGSIELKADSLSIKDAASINTVSYGLGNAGNITIDVKDSVNIAGYAVVDEEYHYSGISSSAAEDPSGKGGNIKLSAGSLSLSDSAHITTHAVGNDAGDISIDVRDEISMDDAWINSNSMFYGSSCFSVGHFISL